MTGLEVWNAVKKYLNLYHHQAVKENIDVETVEGMPINIIEKELKALNEILSLYGKWLGYEISDFEFFTLLNDTLDKYDLLKRI